MHSLISSHTEELADLCRRFGVARLYLFGSATTGRFRPAGSDLDFLVEMTDRRPSGEYADRYLGLAEALEQLFARRVDLVTEQSVRNPHLRGEIEATRQLVYEQQRQETAV